MIAWWQNPCNITPSYCIFFCCFVDLLSGIYLFIWTQEKENSRVIKQFFFNIFFSPQTQRPASAYILFLWKQTGDLSHVIKVTAVFFKAKLVFKCFHFFSPFNGSHDEEVVIHPVSFFPLIMSSWKGVVAEMCSSCGSGGGGQTETFYEKPKLLSQARN